MNQAKHAHVFVLVQNERDKYRTAIAHVTQAVSFTFARKSCMLKVENKWFIVNGVLSPLVASLHSEVNVYLSTWYIYSHLRN